MYICSIYEKRPQICKDFPDGFHLKKTYPSCTYWFNSDGEKKGECSRCGECCKYCKIFTKKVGRCKYLIEER